MTVASLLWGSACLDPVRESAEKDASPDLNSSFSGSDQTSGFDIGALGGDTDSTVASDIQAGELDTASSMDIPSDLAGDASPADSSPSSDTTPGCGDGQCNGGAGESCLVCPADCGACPAFCGNGVCDSGESCSSCSADCGSCTGPVCEVLTSKNCAAGQQCFPDGKQNLCYPAGSKLPGEPCSLANDCTVGVLCVAGQCRVLCDSTGANPAAACKPGVPCEKLIFDGAGDVGQGVGVCKPAAACDPLSDSGCPQGQKCNPSGWFKSCASPGSGVSGALCTASSQCNLGLLCHLNSSGEGVCRPRCHTGGGTPSCTSGSCTPMVDSAGQALPGSVGTCYP